jgi:hypothetical protein
MSAIPVPQPQFEPSRCQLCQGMHQTRPVTFHRNVGMLFARRTYSTQGSLCRSCMHKKYWEFTGKNLLLGPWGTISLIVTPIYLIQNTAVYASTLYKLRDAIE